MSYLFIRCRRRQNTNVTDDTATNVRKLQTQRIGHSRWSFDLSAAIHLRPETMCDFAVIVNTALFRPTALNINRLNQKLCGLSGHCGQPSRNTAHVDVIYSKQAEFCIYWWTRKDRQYLLVSVLLDFWVLRVVDEREQDRLCWKANWVQHGLSISLIHFFFFRVHFGPLKQFHNTFNDKSWYSVCAIGIGVILTIV